MTPARQRELLQHAQRCARLVLVRLAVGALPKIGMREIDEQLAADYALKTVRPSDVENEFLRAMVCQFVVEIADKVPRKEWEAYRHARLTAIADELKREFFGNDDAE
jgi:hypothetical protein